MSQAITTLLLCLVFLTGGNIKDVKGREVTNEEIRDAILSLVHSYSLLDNKLERHEHRERALGEILKRQLQTLQKGQKVYEPMNGVFGRLDERVSQIETMLIQQEEKYNAQTAKLGNTIEKIFKWMTENEGCLPFSNGKTENEGAPNYDIDNSNNNNNKFDAELLDKIDEMSDSVKVLVNTSKVLLNHTNKLMTSSQTDDIMTKLEDKLTTFYVSSSGQAAATTTPAPIIISQKNEEFERKTSQYLEKILTNIEVIKNVPKLSDKLTSSDKEFMNGLTNDTLKGINWAKLDILMAIEEVTKRSSKDITDATSYIQNSIKELYKDISIANNLTAQLLNETKANITELNQNYEVLNKFDKILVAASNDILDTQRKVDYGTHQILQKVSEYIEDQTIQMNNTLKKRFDDIDNSIVNNHLEALRNLSSIMEYEISHVWRQIEIMHSEISYSKDALNKLQGQTENYVNGTISTMDSMEGKVLQITSRMTEVDSNLNYLLGRLSLVTQEFNQIKLGLTKALDQIRNSFQEVQDKIKDVGPGPHPIDDEEPDINLLPQNDEPKESSPISESLN